MRQGRRGAPRLFGLLLLLYPRSFRTRFGPAMRETFAEELTDARGRGAVVAVWARALLGMPLLALEEHGRAGGMRRSSEGHSGGTEMVDRQSRRGRWPGVSLLDLTLGRAMEIADDEFRPVLGLALTTGIDRQSLLAVRVRDWADDESILSVPDEKTDARFRLLLLEPGMAVYVRQLAAGKEPHEPLVPFSHHVIRKRWESPRGEKKLNRPELRWKDLRGVFATYAVWCAWPIRDLQYWMGHATLAMTARYTRRLPARTKPEPGEIAVRMGLDRAHLQLKKGGLA